MQASVDMNYSHLNSGGRNGVFYYGWVVLAACLIITIVASGLRFSFGVFFRSLSTDLALSRAETSEVFSVYMVLSTLSMVTAGWALDRYQPRLIFALMGFFSGLSLLLTSFASELWQFFISYSLLLSLGTGAVYTHSISVALKWFIKNRGLATGVVASGMGLGIMLMSPISAWLIDSQGWQVSYRILAIVAFVIMIPCALLLKWDISKTVLTYAGEVDNSISLETKNPRYNKLTGFSLSQAARIKDFWSIVMIRFFFAVCVYIVLTHIVSHAIDLGITSINSSFILSLIGGSIVTGMLLMGRISDCIGRKQTIMICLLLTAGSMLWLVWSDSLWMLYVFAVSVGFSQGGIAPSLNALIGDSFGMRHIGVIMGVLNTPWAIGASLGPALAGYIYDCSGSYIVAFLTGFVAVAITVILAAFLRVTNIQEK